MKKHHFIRAMEQDLVVEMIYLSDRNEISHRKIKILQLNEYSMVAYCYLRKTRRTFSYRNILSSVPLLGTRERVV
ncbi:transcriptional regulator [Jeotgalibacillus sp. ET6]|uniref:transcriptional regulator n=1 Tax=Jeotgalibacillus sp. ET6 TaxID=3037260 RepID=UPI0024188DB8|nr:transcriptional regulator [Jeotgalibacillus sp. ET6]MDG5471773.1 transcriptional regulator [Jeotgalibacillus sp. ET6]